MRCFLAVELPQHAKDVLAAVGAALRDIDPTWAGEKWVSAEVLHVTLRFLGELEPLLAERIAVDFAAAVTAIEPFSLEVTELVPLPRLGRASMIWAGVSDSSGRCHDLAEAAERVAQANGLVPESRPFSPHVTLVRTRHTRSVAATALSEAASRSGLRRAAAVSVVSATLFASTLTPTGPVYERLAEFALGCQ